MTDTPVDNQTDGKTSTDEKNLFAEMSSREMSRFFTAFAGPPERPRRERREAPRDKAVWLERVSDVVPRRLDWMWAGRIPLGKVTLMAGDAGIGKSTLLFDFAARVSRGALWPDGTQVPEGSVLILSADDDVADTITPRLIAARAEIGRITIVKTVEREEGGMRRFVLPEDVHCLWPMLDELGDVRLVVIDPLTAFLGEKGLTKDADVLGVLDALGALASEKNVAIVCSYHFGKGSAKRANHRFRGSIALTIHARTALVVELRPGRPGERLLALSKQNLGPPVLGMSFTLDPTTIATASGPIETVAIAWNDTPVAWTADEAVAEAASGGGGARVEAMAFLSEALAQGPLPAGEVLKRAKEAGIGSTQLRTAREKLGIRAVCSGFQAPWMWTLPEKP